MYSTMHAATEEKDYILQQWHAERSCWLAYNLKQTNIRTRKKENWKNLNTRAPKPQPLTSMELRIVILDAKEKKKGITYA